MWGGSGVCLRFEPCANICRHGTLPRSVGVISTWTLGSSLCRRGTQDQDWTGVEDGSGGRSGRLRLVGGLWFPSFPGRGGGRKYDPDTLGSRKGFS